MRPFTRPLAHSTSRSRHFIPSGATSNVSPHRAAFTNESETRTRRGAGAAAMLKDEEEDVDEEEEEKSDEEDSAHDDECSEG